VLNKREFTSRWTGMYLRQKTLAGFSSSKNVEKTKVLHYSCSKAAFLVNSKYGTKCVTKTTKVLINMETEIAYTKLQWGKKLMTQS